MRFLLACLLLGTGAKAGPALWENGKPACRLVLPDGERDPAAARLARSTVNGLLTRFYGIEAPEAKNLTEPGTYIVVGPPQNNPSLAAPTKDGPSLTSKDIGDEGFHLVTHEKGGSRYVVVYGKTPRALKHGCQELVFYRTPATAAGGSVDWPLDVVMKPEFAYRSTYMLPCWSYM